jgi:hypothetical protein
MSTDELRRMLDYPDDGFVVDLAAVRERAHQQQARRRRLGAIGVIGAACAVVVAVTLGPLTGSAPRTVLVSPSDEGTTSATSPAPATSSPSVTAQSVSAPPTSAPAASSPATPTTHAATVIKASGATRVPMGQDWFVWVAGNGEVCRSSPSDKPGGPRYQPFGCRSTTDSNIAGLGIQTASSPAGAMYSAVIPYARARVEMVIDGKHLAADTVRFDRLKNWTFYYLWVPSTVADPSALHVGVVAYDRNGTKVDQFGAH